MQVVFTLLATPRIFPSKPFGEAHILLMNREVAFPPNNYLRFGVQKYCLNHAILMLLIDLWGRPNTPMG